ncbi:hypothetical protein SAMN05443579_117112 [Variovorax sp. PDC80]|nr:hypothetical protein SAMN05443579_117112 [Variovorax sp. PDC80]
MVAEAADALRAAQAWGRAIEIDGCRAELRLAMQLRAASQALSRAEARIVALEADVAGRDHTIAVLREEVQRVYREGQLHLEQLMQTRSMRLTKPLRDLGDLVRRWRR